MRKPQRVDVPMVSGLEPENQGLGRHEATSAPQKLGASLEKAGLDSCGLSPGHPQTQPPFGKGLSLVVGLTG